MKIKNPIVDLSRFELVLWLSSVVVVSASYLLSGAGDVLTVIASLIGVTALIFVAKGYVFGQILCVIFSVFYGVISLFFGYYGEMITYLGMSAPVAFMAVISWLKNPYKDTKEVTVNKKLTAKQRVSVVLLSAGVTVVFYFILDTLDTVNLLFSTVSVTTSFAASYLTYLRSAYYGIVYGLNDVVLIILWSLASVEDISYIPMVACFVMFLVNDLYGFVNWQRLLKKQNS